MISITDKYNNTNGIDYTSIKSRRLIRSALAEESFALADACDAAILIQKYLKIILKRTLKIIVLTDSATLFNSMIRNTPTNVEILFLYIKAAKEAYNVESIDDIIRVRHKFNVAIFVTKKRKMLNY